ncbi:Chorismate mutase, type II [Pseudopedobacter saltans DSM 12145]|uniref:chorismate mutase n=1 Tax=Pseudopedobacter saltans (strain ATCC 51119 / DSM 12145 / JCM 21818 / CCUG 39354 / LMG 10337 / NBRC 100064 / NCIMB 13643) TaxID=762903 RepID=F0S8D1_PSESL|nr:chorismate mutase [Pseudopedobacter saltans]ADY53395.1 Chorismate mutase, type II [Pseudopedobacter saltans DSM 12145]
MKSTADCKNIRDVRDSIDFIDRELIGLIGRRAEYVKKAAEFKSSERDVRAADRVETMLKIRKIWAAEENISPEIIEKIYRDLVAYFVAEELHNWKERL